MNPLGVHFIPVHTGKHHYDYIRALQPGIAKVVGTEFPDVQHLSDTYAAAPQAIHYWRNHALSEQHSDLWRDPEGTGKRHASELVRDAEARYAQAKERGLPLPDRDQVRLLGINEPVVELFPRDEDMSNYGEWLAMMQQRTPLLDTYMDVFGQECNARGYGAGLGNFSSGQSANRKPGEYPTFTWFPRTTRLLERTRGRNALAVHEYWRAETGPEGWWDWHTCRFFHYEVDCDIDVLECGVDQWITGANQPGNRGYQGHIEPSVYAQQTGRYVRRAMTDSRFRGATPFTLDGDKMWWSFYIEPAMADFVRLAAELRAVARPAEKPSKPSAVYAPVVSGPTVPDRPPVMASEPHALTWPVRGGIVTQRWGERPEVYAQYGAAGHNGLDIGAPLGTPILAIASGVVAWVGTDQDYGNYVRLFHPDRGLHSFYAHCETVTVQAGQQVKQGQQIATVGSTGNSTGPHLHLEIRLGDANGYGQAAFGHSRGRVDPQTVFAVLGTI